MRITVQFLRAYVEDYYFLNDQVISFGCKEVPDTTLYHQYSSQLLHDNSNWFTYIVNVHICKGFDWVFECILFVVLDFLLSEGQAMEDDGRLKNREQEQRAAFCRK